MRERKGRFLGKIVYTQCNETLPVYGREEKRGNAGVTRGERKVSKEREERVRAAVKKKKEGGARAFCNFYNLNSAAAGVARNCSNPEERVSLRVYF